MLTPQDRKAELVRRGITQTSIAAGLGVTNTQVAEVIAGRRRSERVEQAIAKAIGKPVRHVFPPRVTAAA